MKSIVIALGLIFTQCAFADIAKGCSNKLDKYESLVCEMTSSDFQNEDSENEIVSLPIKNLNSWENIICTKDKFNASKLCTLSNSSLMISIYNGKKGILVGQKHFPHKSSAIKIDNGTTFYGKEGVFKNEDKIISELLKGKTVYTRYVEWPYTYNVDDEISLNEFNKAYQKLKSNYDDLK